MSRTLEFKASAVAYRGLALVVDKARDGSNTIRVPKAALAALLDDHGAACGKLKELGVEYTEPAGTAADTLEESEQ